MLNIGIREIKNNPSIITKGVEDRDNYIFISGNVLIMLINFKL